MDNLLITAPEIAIRLVIAVVFGAIIGWEREARNKPSGLRTHVMVSLGAASFTLITLQLFEGIMASGVKTNSDPLRIVEGVIGGLGFLGAGNIIQSRGSIEGITTASSIWVVGAIGLACGCGRFMIAGVTLVLALVVLVGLGAMEKRVFKHHE